MWDLQRNKKECAVFLDAVEAASERGPDAFAREDLFGALPPNLREHVESCNACSSRLDNLLTTRNTLRGYAPPANFDAPWFAARVMARISAEERVRSSQEAVWKVLPRLASRLAGVAALVLILAGGWLIKRPAESPSGTATMEGLFDTSPAPVTHDDVLASVLEKSR